MVVFTVLSRLVSRTRRRRKAHLAPLGPDEEEYNSGESPICYMSRRDSAELTSMSTVESQFTELGETVTQTYTLDSIESRNSRQEPVLLREVPTTTLDVNHTRRNSDARLR